MLLKGKAAIVTGSSKGIGRAFVMGLAREGANVLVSGTVSSDVDHVVQEIKNLGHNAVGCVASVATMDGAKKIIETAVGSFGRLDILVNNAGVLRDRTILKMEEEEWDTVIAVHLKGTFACSKFAALEMIKQNSGCIINITSGNAFKGNYGQSNYSAAKSGIIGLSLSLAQELARYNIRVNVVWPRALTRMTEPLIEKRLEKSKIDALEKNMPAPSALDLGFGSPEMVAPLVVFLASNDAKDITGKIFGTRGELVSALSLPKEISTAVMVGGWSPEELRKRFWSTIGNAL